MVKHLITERERPLVYTDRAMTEASVTDPELEWETEQRAILIEQQMNGTSQSTVA